MVLAIPAPARRPVQTVAGLEHVVAPLSALALLLHPTPLTWPALVLGLLPSAVRLFTTGRPWRATPFDPGLVLFLLGGLIGAAVSLDPAGAGVRLAGLASAVILFAWVREQAVTPSGAYRAAITALLVVALGSALMLHLAQPFLRLDRVPPLAWLAALLEPLGLYRFLVADAEALQRFRLYASGTGAVAAVGLAMTAGLALAAPGRHLRWPLLLGGLGFGALLLVADNRGSMLAAALTVGCLVVWWRPSLRLVAVLVVFGMLDLIGLGLVQRGFNFRTVVERLDFWQKGLALAAETPLTGAGLGVVSVQEVYRTAFQPAYPPFSHTHSIFVQALLEQGVLGLAGLLLLCLAVVRLGPARHDAADPRRRAASFVALGGALALLTAGLTEIVALTTVGGALLFGLLGLLAAAHDGEPTPVRLVPGVSLRVLVGAVLVLALAAAFVLGRQLAALPFFNLGTSALYRGTVQDDLSRATRDEALARAVGMLRTAVDLDPGSVPARRNLALALAANGDRSGARRRAAEARSLANSGDHDALFGIGRAYAASGAWQQAIGLWSEIGAGPQLLRMGRDLVQGSNWEAGNDALIAAASVGAPERSAQDAITRAALARGLSPEAAVGQLDPLLGGSGTLEYFTRLQAAHVYRQAGRLDLAEQALADALRTGHDEQADLERALILVAEGRLSEAEPALAQIVGRRPAEPWGLPDGDDPRYWLALVQLRLGRPADALATARSGLAELSTDQGSLRAPYQAVLGESLLALGRPAESLAAFRAGLRIAPNDVGLTEGVRRAQAAAGR